jgi:hypothetical protein
MRILAGIWSYWEFLIFDLGFLIEEGIKSSLLSSANQKSKFANQKFTWRPDGCQTACAHACESLS